MCSLTVAWIWTRGFSWSAMVCAPTRSASKAATHRPTRTATPDREKRPAVKWRAMWALGACRGINPGMGWLFAVALGMQRRSVRGVWRALPPIALGPAGAVSIVLAAAATASFVVPVYVLKAVIATMLIALGSYRLW